MTTDPQRGLSIEETAARYAATMHGDPKAAELYQELQNDVLRAADPYIYPEGSQREESTLCDQVSDGKSNREMRAFLSRVEHKVCVERQNTYDVPEVNHKRTGVIVTECIGKPMSAMEVCQFNLGQKLSRLAHEITMDSLEDIAGYAANMAALLAAELPVNGT